MKYIKGDLVRDNHQFDVIGHGCNCFLNMGAGIAKTIKHTFKAAYLADLNTKYGDKSKLGTYTHAVVGELTIVNLYTQYKYSRSQVEADYNAIRKCMRALKKDFSGKVIGLPLIGAGLAGGDWNTIENIIKEELVDEDVVIVIWEGDKRLLQKFGLQQIRKNFLKTFDFLKLYY